VPRLASRDTLIRERKKGKKSLAVAIGVSAALFLDVTELAYIHRYIIKKKIHLSKCFSDHLSPLLLPLSPLPPTPFTTS